MGAHKEQFGQDVSPWGILMSPRQNDNQNAREETLFTLPADNSIQQEIWSERQREFFTFTITKQQSVSIDNCVNNKQI